MSKNITFTANEPLTTEQMNFLLQDSQILQTIGESETDLMSQKAIKKAITIEPKTELGNKTNLQEAFNYLSNIFNGTNKVSKLSVSEIDIVD